MSVRQREEIQELLRTHSIARAVRSLVVRSVFAIIGACVLGTASLAAAERAAVHAHASSDRARIEILAEQLAALSPSVNKAEAKRTAAGAVLGGRALAREYAMVGPPLFHNFLVNTRVKKRGLCFQWTEDLMARLGSVRLRTLQLHWADARATTWREHNSVVVTAKGEAFDRGIVLDAWRHSGRLFWGPVRGDHYPWIEVQSRCAHRPHHSSS